MIDLEFLERLIRAMDESGLDSIELERGGTRIHLAKSPPQAAAPAAAAPPAYAPVPPPGPTAPTAGPASAATEEAGSEEDAEPEPDGHLVDVTSPMVGTFYRAPAPDAPPYVDVGRSIGKGDTLCIIEAMKLMNELEAEITGTVAEICVDNAEPVEFGQVLFRIDPR